IGPCSGSRNVFSITKLLHSACGIAVLIWGINITISTALKYFGLNISMRMCLHSILCSALCSITAKGSQGLKTKMLTFIYPFFTRGRPFPLQLLFFGMLFCIYNGFLQGYYLIYCAEYPNDWCTDIRFTSGLLLFLLGMGINIHSDLLLRQLRKPGEVTYKIPQGGLFTYISGANYFGEIVEWFGFAIATWSLPAFAFAFFTLCCIGPRAYHHHRYYLKTFTDYPKSRKALIPFVF
uniref:3-oxo-5alpha-steroid 4-dehydrogenase (NADP(+)) n=1 Tax=Buteo japonicus TaxID=224669 RepID=A0A8C0BCF3_9AVES